MSRPPEVALAEQHDRGVVTVLQADQQPRPGRRRQQSGHRFLKLSRGILHAQPPPLAYWVNRMSAVMARL